MINPNIHVQKCEQLDAAIVEIAALKQQLQSAREELQTVRSEFADEVIALITTEQASMSRLYEKHSYGINKVCNRLKLFVGDLLKKQKETPS